VTTAEEYRRRKAARRVDALPIPEAYKGKRIEDLEVRKENTFAIETASDWLSSVSSYWPKGDDPGRGLLFYGKPGTGKTLLASVVLETAVRRGATGDFVRLSGFQRMQGQRISLSKSPDDEDQARGREIDRRLDTLHEVGLLVVDDVGQEYGSDYTARNFSDLLRYRYDSGHPTILTSNLAPEKWGKGYGEATMSFIRQACFLCPFGGDDFRPVP
jgi:DNA replication protein DnaC